MDGYIILYENNTLRKLLLQIKIGAHLFANDISKA